jgi:hypothetical protein
MITWGDLVGIIQCGEAPHYLEQAEDGLGPHPGVGKPEPEETKWCAFPPFPRLGRQSTSPAPCQVLGD